MFKYVTDFFKKPSTPPTEQEIQQIEEIPFNRSEYILKDIEKHHRGIEIAPYFSPIAPKAKGYNFKILDIYDYDTLHTRADIDKHISDLQKINIEHVDYVGSATEISKIVPQEYHGTFDCIISSHNFEHLPNPIKFLRGCNTLLKEGGILSMAIPDSRACFEFFRFPTRLESWISAYKEDRQKPTREQVFSLKSSTAVLQSGSDQLLAFSLSDMSDNIRLIGDLGAAYDDWLLNDNTSEYEDTHCSIMTPASLELLLRECIYLGLIQYEIEDISPAYGCEFFVRLRNRRGQEIDQFTAEEIMSKREQLLHKIIKERLDITA